jgi:hypothetical protein
VAAGDGGGVTYAVTVVSIDGEGGIVVKVKDGQWTANAEVRELSRIDMDSGRSTRSGSGGGGGGSGGGSGGGGGGGGGGNGGGSSSSSGGGGGDGSSAPAAGSSDNAVAHHAHEFVSLQRENGELRAELVTLRAALHATGADAIEVVVVTSGSEDDDDEGGGGGGGGNGGGSSSRAAARRRMPPRESTTASTAAAASAADGGGTRRPARCTGVKTQQPPDGVSVDAFLHAFRGGELQKVQVLVEKLGVANAWFLNEGLREGATGASKSKAQKAKVSKVPFSTLLMLACGNAPTDVNCAETCELLVSKGADPFVLNSFGFSPMHELARRGFAQTLQTLLVRDSGGNGDRSGAALADIRVESPLHGWDAGRKEHSTRCPLHYAAECGHDEAVEALLEAGASPNMCDNERQSPLHKAVQAANSKSVKLLLARGANVDAVDTAGYRPIHWTVPQPRLRDDLLPDAKSLVSVVEQLHSAGADMNARCGLGGTALDWLVTLDDGRYDRYAVLAKALVLCGAEADVPCEWGDGAGDCYKCSPLVVAKGNPHLPKTCTSMQAAHTQAAMSSGVNEAGRALGRDVLLPLTDAQFNHLKMTYFFHMREHPKLHDVDYGDRCQHRQLQHYSNALKGIRKHAEAKSRVRKGSYSHTIEIVASKHFSDPTDHALHFQEQLLRFFEPPTDELGFNPARLQNVEVVQVPNNDRREALRGHSMVVATADIPYRTVIGCFTGLVSFEKEADQRFKGSFLDINRRNEYAYNFTNTAVAKQLSEDDDIVIDPLGEWGNEAAAINDPSGGEQQRGSKGKVEANCEFMEVSFRGFLYLFVVAAPKFIGNGVNNVIKQGEELLVICRSHA